MTPREQNTSEQMPERSEGAGKNGNSQDTENAGAVTGIVLEQAGRTIIISPQEGEGLNQKEKEERRKREEERARVEDLARRLADVEARAKELSKIDGSQQIDEAYLEEAQKGNMRYTADGRALPRGDSGVWDLKRDERDILLQGVIKGSGNDHVDEKVRCMINDRHPQSITDKAGCLILRNEPLIGADYTGFSSFVRNGEGKLTRIKVPKGNSGRIAFMDRAGVPYQHITTSGEATLFLGKVSDDDLDYVPLWIEERALELFTEAGRSFKELAAEKGFKDFADYKERAKQELEELVRTVGIREDALQAELQKFVKDAHLLRRGEKLFPNDQCVLRVLLESVYDKELRVLRLRDLAIRKLHRPRLIRTVYCGETTGDRVGPRQVDIMEYWEHVQWAKLCHMFGLEDLLKIAFLEPLEELFYLNKNLGIVHRDLKPANLMINGKGQAKIGDFGVAKTDAREATKTRGLGVGSAPYMSPEQRWGKSATGKSDIYSLGLTLYDIVRGEQTFTGRTKDEILDARDGGTKPLAPTKCPDFYMGLDKLGFFAKRARVQLVEHLETLLTLVLQEDPGNRIDYEQAIESTREVLEGKRPKIYGETVKRFEREKRYYEKRVFDSHTKKTTVVRVPLWEPGNLRKEAFSDTETVVVNKEYKSLHASRTNIEPPELPGRD